MDSLHEVTNHTFYNFYRRGPFKFCSFRKEDMACKEPTLRKSFTIQKQEAFCACVYGMNEYLATGLSNGTVMLLPTKPDNKVRKWIGHRGPVTCMASCGRDPHLVSGGSDGTVRLWVGNDVGDSMALNIGEQEIVSLALSNKYDRLLVTDASGAPTLWDPRHCAKITDLEEDSSLVNSVSLSSDGLVALTGSSSGEFKLFDLRSGQVSHSFNTNIAITATSVRQTGSAIAVGCEDGTVVLWDCRTQAVLNDSPLHRKTVTSLDFHPSKPMLLTSSADGAITVCDSDSRGLLYTLQCHTSAVYNASWSADGTTFSSVGADNRVVMWDEPVVDYVAPIPEVVDRTKVRSPVKQRLTRFNEPIPRDEPAPLEPEIDMKIPVKCEEVDQMKKYVSMMHSVTDQIANMSKMLSKIEARMNAMDEQIAILEVQKRKQAKKVLQAKARAQE